MARNFSTTSAGSGGRRERIDIGLEMRGVTRAGQHDIHARLVAAEAIGGIDQRSGVRLVQDEAERVVHVDVPRIKLAEIDQFLKRRHQLFRSTEGTADSEHDLHGYILRHGLGKDGFACGLVQNVETDHDHIPQIIGQGKAQHLMGRVLAEHLGDADEANLALVA